MFGIFIAVIIFACKYLLGDSSLEVAYFASMNFLWIWYWIVSGLLSLFVIIMVLMTLATTTVYGAASSSRRNFSKIGAFLGLSMGAGISFFIIVSFVFSRALFLVGAYLLMTAGNPGMVFSDFNTTKLIFGTVLLVLGIALSRKSKSSNS